MNIWMVTAQRQMACKMRWLCSDLRMVEHRLAGNGFKLMWFSEHRRLVLDWSNAVIGEAVCLKVDGDFINHHPA